MNSSARIFVVPLLVFFAAGWGLRPLASRVEPSPLQPHEFVRLGGTAVLGVLGGIRSVVAGGLWLRTYQAWERQDPADTRALLELTVAADDRPVYFWLNGARMMAYDFPAWTNVADRPEAVRRRAAMSAVEEACAFLEQGSRTHPHSADFLIEMANIRLRGGGDRETAAELFRGAAELPNAPYYAARIHGELLRELGRPRDALVWLRKVLPTLPAGDPAACRTVVEQRIKALEAELAEK